jgi:Carboxypeptidase regulatory-like domain/Bacterial Ig-like domain (group 2)
MTQGDACMKRVCLFAMATLAITTAMACTGSSVDNPVSPTPQPATAATVTALVLTNQSITEATMQLTATARMSDGATRDVTPLAAWQSSNTSIATISPSGVLTIVANGEVEVQATYLGASGALRLFLTRPPDPRVRFALGGTVREVNPTAKMLGTVRITITSGPDAGTAVTSDASGRFRFTSISATRVSLEASRDGYLPWRMTNLMIDGDKQIEVVMYPTPPTNPAGETATGRCKDSTWTWSPSLQNACVDNGGLAYGVCPGPLCGAPLKQP